MYTQSALCMCIHIRTYPCRHKYIYIRFWSETVKLKFVINMKTVMLVLYLDISNSWCFHEGFFFPFHYYWAWLGGYPCVVSPLCAWYTEIKDDKCHCINEEAVCSVLYLVVSDSELLPQRRREKASEAGGWASFSQNHRGPALSHIFAGPQTGVLFLSSKFHRTCFHQKLDARLLE